MKATFNGLRLIGPHRQLLIFLLLLLQLLLRLLLLMLRMQLRLLLLLRSSNAAEPVADDEAVNFSV